MTREEAIKFWEFRYENAKDFSDPHWEAQERREHREYVEALHVAIEALQSDRPQGEWIDVNGDGSLWRCSRCKDTACCKGNFCPNCGAIMNKGGDTE